MVTDIPNLSAKEAEILRVLITQGDECYGLEMIELSGKKLKLGTLYTTLARMEEKGYVESRKEDRREGARGLPRRMYKCTGLGEKLYKAREFTKKTLSGELGWT